jgi:transposase
LTTDLVVKYDGICIEDLSVKGLVRTKLAKSMTDTSLGEFRSQLEVQNDLEQTPPCGDRPLVSI